MTSTADDSDVLMTSDEEIEAQNLVERGEIDRAIAIYQRMEPQSARVLHRLGLVYAGKKGDYQSAIIYFQQALQIQEKDGSDICETLTELGFAYQNLREHDLALTYHHRALSLQESDDHIDRKSVAINLLGLANAYWSQQNLLEALTCAQRALTLSRTMMLDNDPQMIINLTILANIYHQSGDNIRALKLAEQTLILLEDCPSLNSSMLVTILNNVGIIQMSAGMFTDARSTFIRLLHIYEKILPSGHSKRLIVEQNIQRIMAIQEYRQMNLFFRLSNVLIK